MWNDRLTACDCLGLTVRCLLFYTIFWNTGFLPRLGLVSTLPSLSTCCPSLHGQRKCPWMRVWQDIWKFSAGSRFLTNWPGWPPWKVSVLLQNIADKVTAWTTTPTLTLVKIFVRKKNSSQKYWIESVALPILFCTILLNLSAHLHLPRLIIKLKRMLLKIFFNISCWCHYSEYFKNWEKTKWTCKTCVCNFFL